MGAPSEPRKLGHYEILESLGRGGMGEVFRARDTRLGREVALKLPSPQVARQPAFVERFLREARALAAIDHPNVVTVHSVEEHEGRPFLTMVLIEGTSLDRHIPEGGMEADAWLRVARAIAEGLAAVHEKGVVHRDLKPGNVMLTEAGRVQLVDFGLAKGAEGHEPELEDLTGTGVALGTVPYMSPEQLRAEAIDAKSDVFSLGIVLYEMATGRHPFRRDSQAQVISAILEHDPPPPVGPCLDLPLPVAGLIGRCLVKDPEGRFASVRELLAELGGEGPLAAGPALPGPTRRPATGSPEAADSAAWPRLQLPSRPSLAILPFDNLSGDPAHEHLATGLWFDLNAELIKLWGLFLSNGSSTGLYTSRPVDARRVGRELGVGHVLVGAVRHAGDRVRLTLQLLETREGRPVWAEQFDRKLEDLFALQDEVHEKILSELGVKLLYGENWETTRLRDPRARERYFEALPLTFGSNPGDPARARELYLDADRLEPGNAQLHAFLGLAWYFEALNGFAEDEAAALAAARRSADRSIELGDADGLAHTLKAMLVLRERQHAEALAAARQALARRPGCPWVYGLLGNIHNYSGAPERGVELASASFRLSPYVPALFPAVLATGYYLTQRPEAAVVAAQRALDFDEACTEALVAMTAALFAAGHEDEARATATNLKRVRPDFTLEAFAEREPYRDPSDLDGLLADLRAAGL